MNACLMDACMPDGCLPDGCLLACLHACLVDACLVDACLPDGCTPDRCMHTSNLENIILPPFWIENPILPAPLLQNLQSAAVTRGRLSSPSVEAPTRDGAHTPRLQLEANAGTQVLFLSISRPVLVRRPSRAQLQEAGRDARTVQRE